MNDYRKNLGEIWPELTAYLDRNGIHNFSIWNAADLIFGYYENADGEVISPEEEKVKAEDCIDNGEIRVPSFEDMLNGNNICQGVVTTTVGKGDNDTPDMFDDYPEPIVEEPAPVAENDNSSVMRGARVRRG